VALVAELKAITNFYHKLISR